MKRPDELVEGGDYRAVSRCHVCGERKVMEWHDETLPDGGTRMVVTAIYCPRCDRNSQSGST